MRHYFKSIIITIASAYIAYRLVPTISIGSDPKNILMAIGGLWVISQIINPLFSLVLLPINLLTFGLISLILNVALVFALLNFLPGFTVLAYDFAGANIDGIILPPIAFNQVTTIILVAAIITFVQKLLHLIFE